jgi:hypothetical protein
MRALANRRTGEVTHIPAGVNPGFGTIPVQGQRLCELDAWVQEKLNSVIPGIAHAAQYEGLTLQSAAATYAEKARLTQGGNTMSIDPKGSLGSRSFVVLEFMMDFLFFNY